MSQGYPVTPHGINSEGLKRRGFAPESISLLRKAYKALYRQGLTLAEALEEIESSSGNNPDVEVLLTSLKNASRGIIR